MGEKGAVSGIKTERLKKRLLPLVHNEPSRIDSFTEDDMNGFLGFVVGFEKESEIIEYLETHPHTTTQELYQALVDLVPCGVPVGQEYLLDEILKDED